MSQQTEKLIAKFLRQEQTSKPIHRYVLRHAAKGKTGNEVETFDITESLSLEELDNLAAMVVNRAQLDADGIGPTIQRYTLTSYLEGERPTGRLAFRMKGTTDLDIDEGDESGEESPTKTGLLTQLMRHNEANNRTLVMSAGSLMTSMARRMESQDRLIESLMEKQIRQFEVVEEAMSRKHERDMEMESQKAKDQRIAFGMEKMAMLLPVIMDKLSGGKMPSKNDPMMLMLGELIGSMSVEQLDSIGRTLGPEQKIVFFTLLKKFQAQKALPNGTPDSGPQKEN